MVHPTLLPLMRAPLLPVVDWTDAPVDLNGLVPFAERWNLFSARVPSHFKGSLRRSPYKSHHFTNAHCKVAGALASARKKITVTYRLRLAVTSRPTRHAIRQQHSTVPVFQDVTLHRWVFPIVSTASSASLFKVWMPTLLGLTLVQQGTT
jgi:hypothetical protein